MSGAVIIPVRPTISRGRIPKYVKDRPRIVETMWTVHIIRMNNKGNLNDSIACIVFFFIKACLDYLK